MKKSIVWLIFLMACLPAIAQQDSVKMKRKIELYGSVYDSFTKAPLKAHLTLLTAGDSAVVDTTTCWTWETNSFYEFKVPARQEDYIIRGSCDGYDDGFLDYKLRHIARNNHFELPRLLLKKKQDVYKEVGLDGVVVTGTKVKIAYRGDTIVYNASAFNLPEGSMLDGLIRQMPGAELKDNGDIYIDGRKVDYLMLNGKEFFKGNNKVMLDNLPYFTVQDVKVYDKSTEESKRIGHDIEKKDYVMDVNLKRQYKRGYTANVEAGAGTDDRYMARLFSLYYDDHTRISFFGNVNNVNETRKPGGEGEWRPSNMPQGLRTTKMTGLHLSTENQDKRLEETFDASFTWDDARNESRSARETFSTDGSIFGASQSVSRQKDFRFSASNHVIFNQINLNLTTDINYANGNLGTQGVDSTMRDVLINHVQNAGYNRYRTLSLNGGLRWFKKFEWGDYVTLSASGTYNCQKPSERFSLQDTRYTADAPLDHRRYYADTHQNDYDYTASAGYIFQMPNNWYVNADASYSQERKAVVNSSYRLDRLANVPAYTPNAPASQLAWLPSNMVLLQQVFDADNSDTYQTMTRSVKLQAGLSHSTDKSYFQIAFPVSVARQHMHYDDTVLDTLARRRYTTFEPSASWARWGRNFSFANYSVSVSQPDFPSVMPTDDTMNPLAIHINNPSLKASITHYMNGNLSWTVDSLKRTISLSFDATLTQRSWGTRTTYNPSTGAYTYLMDNINGNWSASIEGSYRQPIDRKRRLTFTQRPAVGYVHSVDFPVLYVVSPTQHAESEHSTVHNLTLGDYMKLEYQIDKLTVSTSGNIVYRLSNSSREGFQRINAVDFDYGLVLNYTIPWMEVTLATDLRMFSRRGYYSALMNDDHLIWNAELSRSFFKGKLAAKLTAFDLLHQLSNTQYTVNAQGRTETWNNCIPRYVMFTLSYKFTQKSKQ